MARGTLLWFDSGRGFGFIRPEFGPRDAFLHASALDSLEPELMKPGLAVEFELVQTGDGRLIARRVTPCRRSGERRRAGPA
jgi:cold shock CspA family protein